MGKDHTQKKRVKYIFYPFGRHWATLSDIGRHTSTVRFSGVVSLSCDKRGRGAVAEPIKNLS